MRSSISSASSGGWVNPFSREAVIIPVTIAPSISVAGYVIGTFATTEGSSISHSAGRPRFPLVFIRWL
jgi:hypothetical protein